LAVSLRKEVCKRRSIEDADQRAARSRPKGLYSAFHMGVQDCDTTDDWLLTPDHWFKIKRSDWLRALLFYFSSRQFSVISRQQYLL
jgi:hypothetical protein